METRRWRELDDIHSFSTYSSGVKGRCCYTKDGKDSKCNLSIGLLMEVQMKSRAETSSILHIKTSPEDFIAMLLSPCPGEVGCTG